MTDHYKTLNVTFEASETEIRMRFRKLASIYHPDKNGGSEKSEETFKIILNAYETLSNKERRAIYDLEYKQYFQQPKSEDINQKNRNSNSKKEQPTKPPPRNRGYQKTEKTKQKINYTFLVVFILLILFYLHNLNTTKNSKADQQLKEQPPQSRPQTGEIDFKNK